ncbi:MAG: hypothetical protein KGO96_07230 [Elusimicrobia bacterium]|nr:hypothetical protein [Elusimicrobiota bacterium]
MDNVNEKLCSGCGATLTVYGWCTICLKKPEEIKYKIQPDPVKNNKPAVWDLVIEEMKNRDNLGLERYGTRLQPFNGRDTLRDAMDEALDLVVYLRTLIYERDGK